MSVSKFIVYNKNSKGISIVTAVDAQGTEQVIFGTQSITQSRKALSEYKRQNEFGRVPQETRLEEGFEAEAEVKTPVRESVTTIITRSNKKRGSQAFNVNARFEMLAQVTDMIALGHQRAELITGVGGTGKTFTVFKTLESRGYTGCSIAASEEESEDTETPNEKVYYKITGAISPLGLYRTLYENSEAILVFDDCDSVFSNPNAVNILKAVLDTSGDGTVSWVSPAVENAGLPTQFQFNGRVIFISNKQTSALPQPILSRSLIVDMDMDKHDILERAKFLDAVLLPKLNDVQRAELFAFVELNLDDFRDVSLRLFVLASPFIECEFPNWRDLVLFTS